MQFGFFGTSDTGCHRKYNEDSYLCNPQEKLFLIADGIGGQAKIAPIITPADTRAEGRDSYAIWILWSL